MASACVGGPTLIERYVAADRLEHLLTLILGHEHARGGDAGLARGAHDHHRGAHRGAVHRVGQIDLRRLAAEFQRDPLDRRRRLGEDLATRHGRPGERHHVDGGMLT